MGSLVNGNPMVWVFVQSVDGVEEYVGQHLKDLDVSFIPFFLERESAESCLIRVSREKGVKIELQAIRHKELARDASASGFLLFLLDADGNILEKLDPQAG